jgi:hypothetical protein
MISGASMPPDMTSDLLVQPALTRVFFNHFSEFVEHNFEYSLSCDLHNGFLP